MRKLKWKNFLHLIVKRSRHKNNRIFFIVHKTIILLLEKKKKKSAQKVEQKRNVEIQRDRKGQQEKRSY